MSYEYDSDEQTGVSFIASLIFVKINESNSMRPVAYYTCDVYIVYV